MNNYYDYLIIGAGIIGLSIARELKQKEADATITILEKEGQLGAHGSGRNSGVLHSGIYYPEHSLKASMCAKGAKAMATYCDVHALPIHRMGKVIVPIKPEDDPQLDLLYQRAQNNDANVNLIDRQQLSEIEPEVRTVGRALHSPNTAIIDPQAILNTLALNLRKQGVHIQHHARVTKALPDDNKVITNSGQAFLYGKLYNAAGQFSDQVAQAFQVGNDYTLLPFKGIYYRLDKRTGIHLNGLVYPVPDMNVPFLGVHSVKKLNGDIYFGPTAIPAFGREHYQGLKGIELTSAVSISFHMMQQYCRNNQGFRRFIHEEAGRFFKFAFTHAAQKLVPRLKSSNLLVSNKVGIRAQLLHKAKHEIVMDFVVERKDNTVHVLNAISPAFTSAFEFAKYIAAEH